MPLPGCETCPLCGCDALPLERKTVTPSFRCTSCDHRFTPVLAFSELSSPNNTGDWGPEPQMENIWQPGQPWQPESTALPTH